MSNSLDLRRFKFPALDKADVAFPTIGSDPQLVAEAINRGYYNAHKSGNEMFSKLFFHGGKVVFKADVSEDFKQAAWPYIQALMASFKPNHEEKEAVCGMLLDELVAEVK
jgi:hypothetical protein